MMFSVIFAFSCNKDKEEELPEGYNFTLMSFNIRQDTMFDGNNRSWKNVRKNLVINYLLEKSADIICLQEVKENQAEDLKEGLKDVYNIVWYPRTIDGSDSEGLAVAYKLDKFNYLEETRFWLSENPEKQSKGWGANYYRISVMVSLQIKDKDIIFDVYSTHLDAFNVKARNEGIKVVVDKIAERGNVSIVCGDFNTTKDNESAECYTYISTSMDDAQQVAKDSDSGITYQDFGNGGTFDDSIDFEFLTKNNFYVKSFKILRDTYIDGDTEIYYSDHYAIMSDVIYKY